MTHQTPLGARELADEYFIENRNRLLEIAAFLDRLDRVDSGRAARDFRIKALTASLEVLASPSPNYVMQLQLLLSDPTTEPIERLDRKSAMGAYDRTGQEVRR